MTDVKQSSYKKRKQKVMIFQGHDHNRH